MSDPELRMKLLEVNTESEFKEILEAHTNALAEKQKNWASEKAMFSAENQEQVWHKTICLHVHILYVIMQTSCIHVDAEVEIARLDGREWEAVGPLTIFPI